MGMIADVVLAVAMEALTARAVTELQFRIAHISATTDCAFVGVRRFHCGGGGFVRACSGEDDGFSFGGSLAGLSLEQPSEICLPGHRNHIEHILAEEQEIVCQCNHGEKAAV